MAEGAVILHQSLWLAAKHKLSGPQDFGCMETNGVDFKVTVYTELQSLEEQATFPYSFFAAVCLKQQKHRDRHNDKLRPRASWANCKSW
ncbi:hypothetical protein NDU88_003288 [Pleurodeles waltl]|uniref:Uncharacterized protein n=1 Tax=Pleurodeles waltl TaxID=8319 RepID=A0AAV7SG64_PLEWA|nr:hypothetical protein NDU88_003288 [Pleurodeles waltl]